MNTDKIYAEAIAGEYAPKDTSKVVALKKLDRKAKSRANIFAYTFGVSMTLATRKSTLLRSFSWPERLVIPPNEAKGRRPMNRSESKYFHTARRMDEALITLLEKKFWNTSR